MKRGGFKIKTVLIIVYFIGNLSFNNLYTFCSLSSDPLNVVSTARYLNKCNFKDRIPDQGVSE